MYTCTLEAGMASGVKNMLFFLEYSIGSKMVVYILLHVTNYLVATQQKYIHQGIVHHNKAMTRFFNFLKKKYRHIQKKKNTDKNKKKTTFLEFLAIKKYYYLLKMAVEKKNVNVIKKSIVIS